MGFDVKGLRMFEHTALRRNEGTGELGYNGELHNFLHLADIISIIKSRRLKWAGRVTHMGDMRNTWNILVAKLLCKTPLRRCRCNGKMVLKWMLRKYDMRL